MEERYTNKVCINCNIDKPLSDFYKNKQVIDGYSNKCISCVKEYSSERYKNLRNNPEWVEKERIRASDKYYRLNYKDKYNKVKPDDFTPKSRMDITYGYRSRYPEKFIAVGLAQKIIVENGIERHHWSYNKEHSTDIIELTIKDHHKAHRFIVYDQERFMYRRCDNNELLDTKERHLWYITWCIENKED